MTEESRLSRWSRLKTKSRPKGRGIFFKAPESETDETEETAVQAATDPAAETEVDNRQAAAEPPDPSAGPEPEQVPEDEAYPDDLPPIESLTAESDFTAFMSERVSDTIRNAALRKLWISNPALANLDGLLDYGEDLTDSFKVVKNMQSAYKVGRGMVDFEEEARLAAEKARERKDGETVEQAEEPDVVAADADEEQDMLAEAEEPVELDGAAVADADHEKDAPVPTELKSEDVASDSKNSGKSSST